MTQVVDRPTRRGATPGRQIPVGRPRQESRVKIVLYLLAAVLSVLVFVVPLVWALMRSLQPNATITSAPDISTFFQLTFDNFRGLADQGHIPRAVLNSLIVSGGTAVLTTVLATHVLRPLVIPGMATTALYAFLAAWTEFLGALTFLTRQDLYTLPLSLVNLQQGAYGQVNYGYLAAGSVIAMVPCVILFVALQRFYVAGLSAGAVKG
jgi:ABC-type glycerol-3-phosphate transport system permease component